MQNASKCYGSVSFPTSCSSKTPSPFVSISAKTSQNCHKRLQCKTVTTGKERNLWGANKVYNSTQSSRNTMNNTQQTPAQKEEINLNFKQTNLCTLCTSRRLRWSNCLATWVHLVSEIPKAHPLVTMKTFHSEPLRPRKCWRIVKCGWTCAKHRGAPWC